MIQSVTHFRRQISVSRKPPSFKRLRPDQIAPNFSPLRHRRWIATLLLIFVFILSSGVVAWSAETFTSTGSMGAERAGHAATQLPNGKVLITGGSDGYGGSPSGEQYDPTTGTFIPAGPMGTWGYSRSTLLPNGKVLITGGGSGNTALASAELYDPATGTFTLTESMGTGRMAHAAILLPNGKVLIAGGYNGSSALASAELYDPVTGTFSPTGSMATARMSGFGGVLLSNGKVLIAGGWNPNSGPSTSAELYDPVTGAFSATGSMGTGRYHNTMTLLPNGEVLIAGGGTSFTPGNFLASAELYDPTTETFTGTGSMGVPRYAHTATVLLNGQVLIAGGSDSAGGFFAGYVLFSAGVYYSINGTF